MFREVAKFVSKFPITRELTTRPVAEIAVRIGPLRRGLRYTREQRLELMSQGRWNWAKETSADFGVTGLEMWSGGIGPYGPGDFLTLAEAIFGHQITGEKLDLTGRVINILAAFIPLLPGRPFVQSLRGYREAIEEQVEKLHQKRIS